MRAVPFGAPFARTPRAHFRASPATGKIQHVVIVIQENRTVDNLFNGYCNPNGQCANTVATATIVDVYFGRSPKSVNRRRPT